MICNSILISVIDTQAYQTDCLYSRPSNITTEFIDNKLIIKSTPEIWNPSSNSFKNENSNLLNFELIFNMNIINNTKSITYTDEILSTLLGYTEIPSGISKQNTFTKTYTFSYNFSNKFQEQELFKAVIEIYTVAPEIITQHSSINGTSINIENNNLSISTVQPNSWGEVQVNTTNSFIVESLLCIGIIVGLLRSKLKKR